MSSRCLAVLSPDFGRSLGTLPALASLAASDRVLVILGTEEQMAVFDPSLLRWRLQHQPEQLATPMSLLRGTTAGALAKQRFDEAIFFAPDWSDTSLARKAQISKLWGYRSGVSGLRLNRGIPKSIQPAPYWTEDARPLIEAMGAAWQPEPLHLPKTWGPVGKERLEKGKLEPGKRPIVGIYAGNQGHLGGEGWAPDSFEELLQLLRRQNPEWQFTLLSDDTELWNSVQIHERTGKIHPVVGPDLAMDSIAAVLHNLDLLISNDSAFLQLCALIGTPTLGLFDNGARRHAPRGKDHRYLERTPIKSLPVDEVLAVCEIMMARR